MQDLTALGSWLTVAASLVTVGVTLGTLPRLSSDLDKHKAADRAEKDMLWADVRKNERDLAHFEKEVAREFRAIE